jgi:hypothetical protein
MGTNQLIKNKSSASALSKNLLNANEEAKKQDIPNGKKVKSKK